MSSYNTLVNAMRSASSLMEIWRIFCKFFFGFKWIRLTNGTVKRTPTGVTLTVDMPDPHRMPFEAELYVNSSGVSYVKVYPGLVELGSIRARIPLPTGTAADWSYPDYALKSASKGYLYLKVTYSHGTTAVNSALVNGTFSWVIRTDVPADTHDSQHFVIASVELTDGKYSVQPMRQADIVSPWV